MDAASFFANPTTSHVLFGALGGLIYVAIYRLHGDRVGWADVALRPFVGACAAVTLTDLLGLPNHFTSLFAGYFGVDVIKGATTYARTRLPLLSKEPDDREPPGSH